MTSLAVPPASPLARLSFARDALEQARTVEDVKTIHDVAAAALRYAQARKLGEESVHFAQEIVLRAIRRMGELLAETPKQHGARDGKQTDSSRSSPFTPPKLSDIGVTYDQSSQSQKVAAVPDADFEHYLTTSRELTLKGLLGLVRQAAKTERRAEQTRSEAEHADATDVDLRHGDFREVLADLDGQVDVILTDPPYPAEYLPLYNDLSEHAARLLRPGGLLAAMVGQTYLPQVLAALATRLDYRWTIAYLTPGGQAVQVWPRRVNTFWKPVVIFRSGDAASDEQWIARSRCRRMK